MINSNRVFAMVLRYSIGFRHNFDRLSDMFYWPALDLLVWGLTGLYFAQFTPNTKETTYFILTGIIFWLIIWRSQYEITVNVMQEIWDKNLVNIFASPLTVSEWMSSFIVVGLFKTILSFSFSALLAYFLYGYSIFVFGITLIPIVINLLLIAWAAGFFIAGFLIRYGQKIQTLAWTGIAIISPFSALYYPLSILPDWAQKIAFFVPPSHVFETMRAILQHNTFSSERLLISFALSVLYLVLSIWFFIFMFHRSRKLGLGRLI